MSDLLHDAYSLGVSVEWLAARSVVVGLSRCPQCWPDHDIIVEGNFIEPCDQHSGARDSLRAPDDERVTAPMVDIVGASGAFV